MNLFLNSLTANMKKLRLLSLLITLLLCLPIFELLFRSLTIYICSTISTLIFLAIWALLHDYKFVPRAIFNLFIAGFLLSVLVTVFLTIVTPGRFPFSQQAFLFHFAVLFQFLLVVSFFSSKSRALIWISLFSTITSRYLVLWSIVVIFIQVFYLKNTIDNALYQGGTSWFSLILLSASLSNINIKFSIRGLSFICSIASILFASKRSTILASVFVLGLSLIKFMWSHKQFIAKFLSSYRIHRVAILSLILTGFAFIVIVNYFPLLHLDKLTLTFNTIQDANFHDDKSLQIISGGRNIEIEAMLKSFQLSITEFITISLTSGFGIGWRNTEFYSSSVHNSFFLLSMLGGFPFLLALLIQWINLLLLFSRISQSNILFSNHLNNDLYFSVLVAIGLGVDALFSANLIASFLCMALFFSTLPFSSSSQKEHKHLYPSHSKI